MAPVFTSLRIAAVLLTAGFCVTTASAQQATRRTAQSSTKTVVAIPKVVKSPPLSASNSSGVTAQPGSPSVSASARSAVAAAQPPASPSVSAAPIKTRPARPAGIPTPASSNRNKYLNVGVGVAAYYGAGLPLGASLEVDLKNQLSVGGSFDYLRSSGGYTFIYAGARGSYHLGELLDVKNKKFDPYAGVTLGFRHFGYPNAYGYDYGGYNSGLFLGAHLGSRYYFSDNVGGFAEVGYGISALKLGLAARF